MIYFTPEAYLELQTNHAAISYDTWEENCEAYWKQVKELPKHIKKLAKNLCLHDWGLVQIDASAIGLVCSVKCKDNDNTVTLTYLLADGPDRFELRHTLDWSLSKENPEWLYDEFSQLGENLFQHEIMFSDGRISSSCDLSRFICTNPPKAVQKSWVAACHRRNS